MILFSLFVGLGIKVFKYMKILKNLLYFLSSIYLCVIVYWVFLNFKNLFDALFLYWTPFGEIFKMSFEMIMIVILIFAWYSIYLSFLSIKNLHNRIFLVLHLIFSLLLLSSIFYAENENDSMSGFIIVYAFIPYIISCITLIWLYYRNKYINS